MNMATLSVKHLLSINDLTRKDIDWIYKKTTQLKKDHYQNKDHRYLKGKVLALLFAKPSTRTRVSFEAGMTQLGGHALDLSGTKIQAFKDRENLTDTMKVLNRYVDCVVARLYTHQNILDIAAVSTIPIINGLTDLLHPCQALSDLFTIKEYFKTLKGIKLAYVGDGNNNVTHSLMHACYKLGVQLTIACPKQLNPSAQIILNTNKKNSLRSSNQRIFVSHKKSQIQPQNFLYENKINITRIPAEAVKNADVIYTDTWVSMGQEKQQQKKIKLLRPYQVNAKLMKQAKKTAIFMHCLPAHRQQEVTNEVIDSKQSIVFDQAENRMHVQKAILQGLLGARK